MNFIFLILAGLLEVVGVLVLKKISMGKKVLQWILLLCITFGLSLYFLGLSMREFSMSVAYAIWTGIGTFGGVILSIVVFKESCNFKKLFFIFLIVASVIGLKTL
ncbi:DMT family transporter [Helicobacter anatolicus]|uniref:DMT family transporter n=1 Tax=Helicobacter anatolicus TaxID=2905874 RepID=UPI001E2DD17D|nr:SMR family transporter [Helicobacter anatolicus]MCE3038040.1 SMR family transporter [Helicobacter anatolicus]